MKHVTFLCRAEKLLLIHFSSKYIYIYIRRFMLTLVLSCGASRKAYTDTSASLLTRLASQLSLNSLAVPLYLYVLAVLGSDINSFWLYCFPSHTYIHTHTCLYISIYGFMFLQHQAGQHCASWRLRRKCDYLVLLYQDGGSHRKRLGGKKIRKNINKCCRINSRINKVVKISVGLMN